MSGGSLFNGRHKESAAEEKMHYSGCERSKDLAWSKVGANQQEVLYVASVCVYPVWESGLQD